MIALVNFGDKFESAHSLINASLRIDLKRICTSHLPSIAVDNATLDIGRLAERVVRLEVDAISRAGDKIAALGEEFNIELCQRNGNRLT